MVEINFEFEKETTNTVKYKEVPEKGQAPRVGTLYLQKWAFPDSPKAVSVTIEEK